VLGADSRVSTGTYIANRVSDKVRKHDCMASHARAVLPMLPCSGCHDVVCGSQVAALHDSIYMCRSGSAADTQAISDYVRYWLAAHSTEVNRQPPVKTAATLARRLCYENKVLPLLLRDLIPSSQQTHGGEAAWRHTRYVLTMPAVDTPLLSAQDALMAGVIVGGWDPVDGGSVYVLPLGGTLMKMPFAIGGSGSTYIYGHVDSAYKPNMSREECQASQRPTQEAANDVLGFENTGEGALFAQIQVFASFEINLAAVPDSRLSWVLFCDRISCGNRLLTPWPATAPAVASFASSQSTPPAPRASTSLATSSRTALKLPPGLKEIRCGGDLATGKSNPF